MESSCIATDYSSTVLVAEMCTNPYEHSIKIFVYIGDVFTVILLATATYNSHYLVALVSLGGATEIG